MKSLFRHIAPLLLVAGLLSSCTTVDLGGAVDNLGREVPVSADYATPDMHHHHVPCYTAADGRQYLRLRVRYLPARAKYFHCFMAGGCPVEPFERFYLPREHPAKTEIWYAEVEDDRFCSITRMIPAAEFSVKDTTCRLVPLPDYRQQMLVCHNLPDRRSGLNTAVQPLRWVAEVADVPLSIIATPVNWLILPTGYSLWSL